MSGRTKRVSRTPAAPSGAAGGEFGCPPPPGTRVFGINVTNPGNGLTAITSAVVRGPAVIRTLSLSKGGGAAGAASFELGVSQNPLNLTQPLGRPRPYAPIFEPIRSDDININYLGPFMLDEQASLLVTFPIMYLVTLPQFFVVFAIVTPAGIVTMNGIVTVYEGIAPGSEAIFL